MTDIGTVEAYRAQEASYADSPVHRALGLSVEVAGRGEVRIQYDGALAATNRRGHPAGGALAEMIDSAVVQAAKTLLHPDDRVTTLELKINFVRAAPAGSPLTTTGSLRHVGRSTAVGLGEIRDSAGVLLAVGLVTVSIRRHDA